MAKTANDVRIDAQLLTGMEIDQRTSFIWVKSAMDDIIRDYPATAAKYYIETITLDEAYSSHELEHYVTSMDKLICKTGNVRSLVDEGMFEFHDNTISFVDRGEYEIRYFGDPEPPKTYSEEIDMPGRFVDCIKYYVAGRITARLLGRDDTGAITFFDDYDKAKTAADNFMRKRMQRTRKMPPAYKGV